MKTQELRPLPEIPLAEREMVAGYLDGANLDNPEPSDNRSHSYRHGFANGRDDATKRPRATAEVLRMAADEAAARDALSLSPEGDA